MMVVTTQGLWVAVAVVARHNDCIGGLHDMTVVVVVVAEKGALLWLHFDR